MNIQRSRALTVDVAIMFSGRADRTVARQNDIRVHIYFTFYSAELVKRLEAGRVVDLVGVERDTEEVAVGDDCLLGKVVRRAAVARHLAVHQIHVEVGKLDEVALIAFVAAA